MAFVLPMNPLTKKENLEYSPDWPSERWAHTRLYGEKANQKLWKYLLSELKTEFGINKEENREGEKRVDKLKF